MFIVSNSTVVSSGGTITVKPLASSVLSVYMDPSVVVFYEPIIKYSGYRVIISNDSSSYTLASVSVSAANVGQVGGMFHCKIVCPISDSPVLMDSSTKSAYVDAGSSFDFSFDMSSSVVEDQKMYFTSCSIQLSVVKFPLWSSVGKVASAATNITTWYGRFKNPCTVNFPTAKMSTNPLSRVLPSTITIGKAYNITAHYSSGSIVLSMQVINTGTVQGVFNSFLKCDFIVKSLQVNKSMIVDGGSNQMIVSNLDLTSFDVDQIGTRSISCLWDYYVTGPDSQCWVQLYYYDQFIIDLTDKGVNGYIKRYNSSIYTGMKYSSSEQSMRAAFGDHPYSILVLYSVITTVGCLLASTIILRVILRICR
ncbi:hypothetical protein AKO1_007033 [Acrasis kona]|uniref:Uncharacterized protein n=1 Tax=Acrasis kona TaxID=1008807 RepID=A0AAW2YV66_9EUKA